MKYLDTKENSIEDSVTRVLMGEKLVGGQKKLDKDKAGDSDGKDEGLHEGFVDGEVPQRFKALIIFLSP